MPNDRLLPGEALSALSSQDGRFDLNYRGDNVVLGKANGELLWVSHTASHNVQPGQAVMQTDGNFVVYDAAGAPVWNSGTAENPGAFLVVQNDGNLVIYGPDGSALWSSGTVVADVGPGAGPSEAGPAPAPPTPPARPAPPAEPAGPPPPAEPAASAPGGVLERADSPAPRARLTRGEIAAFVPERGPFRFPAPYNTLGIRVTNERDCPGGVDCIGYSYWRNINNHQGDEHMLVFVGCNRSRGGAGPSLFQVSKSSGHVQPLGPLFDAGHALSFSTGEGWYFSATQPHTLYIGDGPRLLRHNVRSGAQDVVFDIGDGHPGCRLWQVHSSNDDRVHAATVQRISDSGPFEPLGCIVFREGIGPMFFPKIGDYDECQVDKSGRYLVIKENVDGRNGEDNRIIDLETGREQIFLDEAGAAGHSDLGYGYMVAEDNFHPMASAVRVWSLDDPRDGRLVYGLTSFGESVHVAHSNARPGDSRRQTVVISFASRKNIPRVNEIVVVPLDGSMRALAVAPNLTDLDTGGGDDDYTKRPKGNVDVTGEHFIWTTNLGTDRLDAILVRLPSFPG